MTDKLTELILQTQIARLKRLPRGEDRPWGAGKKGDKNYEPGLRDELLKALWEQSSSNEHAERIINRVMEIAQFCPAPAELITTAATIPYDTQSEQEYSIPYERPDSKAFCATCKGNGMVQNGARWQRCACAIGQEYPEKLIDMQNVYEARQASPRVLARPLGPPSEKSMKPVTEEDINAVLNQALRGHK